MLKQSKTMALSLNCELCEKKQWFGRQGICDPVNLTCICPEGFSGKDDFLTFTACQVNDNLREGIHILFLSVSIVGLLAGFICFILLARKWRFSSIFESSKTQDFETRTGDAPPDDLNASSSYSLFSPPVVKNRNYNSFRNKEITFRNWKRKQYTLLALLFILLFYIGGILFNFPMIRGDNRQDAKVIVCVGFFLITLGGATAAAFLILTWYYTLPDVSKYGALLRINNLFVRYPGFFPKALARKAIVVSVVFCITTLIIPLSDVTDEVRFYTDLITGVMFIVGSVANAVCLIVIMNAVEQIYGLAVAAFESPRIGAVDSPRRIDLKMMKQVMKPIKQAKVICTAMMLFIAIMASLHVSRGSCESYVFFNFGFVMFSLFMLSAPLGFVMLDDYLTPKAFAAGLTPPA